MTEERLKLGAWGEDEAVRYLRKLGARILFRNFTTPVGEIDIIARLKKKLLFVEVKTRSSHVYGSPADAVGPRKQQQIIRTAQWYLQQGQHQQLEPRFDVVTILVNGHEVEIEHFPDAFEA